MNYPKMVWAKLDSERRARKFSMKNLAQALDISVNTITRDSKVPEKMPIGRFFSYCEALSLSPDSLIEKH